MKKKDKELLSKDLFERLPYGIICKDEYGNVLELNGIDKPNTITFNCSDNTSWTTDLDKCKPYLFPLSSMTEEHRKEYQYNITEKWMYDSSYSISDSTDWLNKNHFDYREFILWIQQG